MNFAAFRPGNPGAFIERVDVDQYRRLRQPEIHRRHQALATCEKPRIVTVLGLQRQRMVERRSCDVFEWSRLHDARSETACATRFANATRVPGITDRYCSPSFET